MLDESALTAAPEEVPASVTVEAVEAPAVSVEADTQEATEATPVVAEAAPAPVSEPEEDLPEPPNLPPPSLDPSLPAPTGLEGHIQTIGDQRLRIAALEDENTRLTAEVASLKAQLPAE